MRFQPGYGFKHGLTSSRTYGSWEGMKQRCLNPKYKRYADYGGRGITVCERWLEFTNFLADMGERPEGTSLDRIDNSKGYGPANCRWATPTQQQRNMRSNKLIHFNGKSLTSRAWSELTGIKECTIYCRIFTRGWPVDVALTRKGVTR